MIDAMAYSAEDETERLTRAIAERRAALEMTRCLIDELFDRSEDGVAILRPDGTALLNPKADAIMKAPATLSGPLEPDWKEKWGFFRTDTGERVPPEALGSFRVMQGTETRIDEELKVVTPHAPEPLFIATSSARLADGGSITVIRDIGRRVFAETELATSSAKLAERDAEHRVLIERLRVALSELATPILQVAQGVLVLPIIGVLDSQRSAQISERLLEEIVRSRASSVIIDVTGVEGMDTRTADRFAKLARGIELLGARCLLSGVQPRVAETLVALGVELAALAPFRNLAHALQSCQKSPQQRAQSKSPSPQGTGRNP